VKVERRTVGLQRQTEVMERIKQFLNVYEDQGRELGMVSGAGFGDGYEDVDNCIGKK
jgi:hypothetical protein